jgi:hypothetical protein
MVNITPSRAPREIFSISTGFCRLGSRFCRCIKPPPARVALAGVYERNGDENLVGRGRIGLRDRSETRRIDHDLGQESVDIVRHLLQQRHQLIRLLHLEVAEDLADSVWLVSESSESHGQCVTHALLVEVGAPTRIIRVGAVLVLDVELSVSRDEFCESLQHTKNHLILHVSDVIRQSLLHVQEADCVEDLVHEPPNPLTGKVQLFRELKGLTGTLPIPELVTLHEVFLDQVKGLERCSPSIGQGEGVSQGVQRLGTIVEPIAEVDHSLHTTLDTVTEEPHEVIPHRIAHTAHIPKRALELHDLSLLSCQRIATLGQLVLERTDLALVTLDQTLQVRDLGLTRITLDHLTNGVEDGVGQANDRQKRDQHLVHDRQVFPRVEVEVEYEKRTYDNEQAQSNPNRVLGNPRDHRVDLFTHTDSYPRPSREATGWTTRLGRQNGYDESVTPPQHPTTRCHPKTGSLASYNGGLI